MPSPPRITAQSLQLALDRNRSLQQLVQQQLALAQAAETQALEKYQQQASGHATESSTDSHHHSTDADSAEADQAKVRTPQYMSLQRHHRSQLVYRAFTSAKQRHRVGPFWALDATQGLVRAPDLPPTRFVVPRWSERKDAVLRSCVPRMIPPGQLHDVEAWKRCNLSEPAPAVTAGATRMSQKEEEVRQFRELMARHGRGDCFARWHAQVDPAFSQEPWMPSEDTRLLQIAAVHMGRDWAAVARDMNKRGGAAEAARDFSLAPVDAEGQPPQQASREGNEPGEQDDDNLCDPGLRRSPWQCLRRFKELISPVATHGMGVGTEPSSQTQTRRRWTQAEDEALQRAVAACGPEWNRVPLVEELLVARRATSTECKNRWHRLRTRSPGTATFHVEEGDVTEGGATVQSAKPRPWTLEEDVKLCLAIETVETLISSASHRRQSSAPVPDGGVGGVAGGPQVADLIKSRWQTVASLVGGRTAAQCAQRSNRLLPKVKALGSGGGMKFEWTDPLRLRLAELVEEHRNTRSKISWAEIGRMLGRHREDCRNEWRKCERRRKKRSKPTSADAGNTARVRRPRIAKRSPESADTATSTSANGAPPQSKGKAANPDLKKPSQPIELGSADGTTAHTQQDNNSEAAVVVARPAPPAI